MNSLLLQIVVATSSMLLTLPAGWCSGSTCARAEHGPAETTCCPSARHDQSAGLPADANQPVGDCCCVWEATVPQKVVQPEQAEAFPLPPIVSHVASNLGSPRIAPAKRSPGRSGLRLHVLYCVWRC